MDYYGLLFLYYLKGLSGKSILRLFFNIETGGTEQLLPENTSTPTTTPILADIQYPDGLRTDQYFTYRETPTTISNKARIKTIKGNTLVWNQLVQNGNFASTSGWGQGGGRSTLSVENNIGTATLINSLSTTYQNYGDVQLVQGHKLLIHYEFKLPRTSQRVFGCENNNTDYMFGDMRNVSADTWHTVNAFHTVALGGAEKITICYFTTSIDGYQLGDQYQVKNLMVFDLTQMGLADKTDDEIKQWFADYFPLPYYAYNQGSLLSFNGNGIKTVGKNLLPKRNTETKVGVTLTVEDDGSYTLNGTATGTEFFANLEYNLPIGKRYKFYGFNPTASSDFHMVFQDTTSGSSATIADIAFNRINNEYVMPTNATPNRIRFYVRSGGVFNNFKIYPMMVFADEEDVSYEPYTSSTLSLPISTYFPNGMNGFNGVYDELTSAKAITRYTRRVFDGTENWTMETLQGKTAFYIDLGDGAYSAWNSLKRYCVCDKFYATPYNAIEAGGRAYGQVALTGRGTDAEFFADFQTVAEWKTWLSNNPTTFVYESKTPTETPITTEDANEALSLLMGKSVSSSNANQLINIITKGE